MLRAKKIEKGRVGGSGTSRGKVVGEICSFEKLGRRLLRRGQRRRGLSHLSCEKGFLSRGKKVLLRACPVCLRYSKGPGSLGLGDRKIRSEDKESELVGPVGH